MRKEITAYQNHPALLAWGIGNEAEGDGTNTAYWQQLERLAVLAKEIDPAHPTFTAVAGLNPAKTKGLMEHTLISTTWASTPTAVFSACAST